jgi:hypothetical protein
MHCTGRELVLFVWRRHTVTREFYLRFVPSKRNRELKSSHNKLQRKRETLRTRKNLYCVIVRYRCIGALGFEYFLSTIFVLYH